MSSVRSGVWPLNLRVITALGRCVGRVEGQRGGSGGTDLCDAWVGTLDILAGQVEPAGGVGIDGRAVVPQGAPSFSAAPAALELPLCFQAHAAAVPLGCALVQVHCKAQKPPSKRFMAVSSLLYKSFVIEFTHFYISVLVWNYSLNTARLSLPWIFSGLSIMKLPFHTTEKSTGSSLILIPSYRYCRPGTEGERRGGTWRHRGEFQREV